MTIRAIDERAESIRVMHPLFQTGEGGSIPTSALSLWFSEVGLPWAKELNRLWHRTLPDVGGGGSRVCYVAECDGRFFASAIWTNPASPKLPQTTWLQLKRLAIAPDAPKNTASRMIAWMTRDVAKRFPEVTTLVSYQDCDAHTGTIYAASGWVGEEVQVRSPKTTWRNRKRAKFVEGKPLRVRRWTKQVTL